MEDNNAIDSWDISNKKCPSCKQYLLKQVVGTETVQNQSILGLTRNKQMKQYFCQNEKCTGFNTSDSVNKRPFIATTSDNSCKVQVNQSGLPYFKVMVLGRSGVGKTSLILRWQNKSSNAIDTVMPSIAVDFVPLTCERFNTSFKLKIWDTAGQEVYGSITSLYLRDVHLAILVYSVNDVRSFNAIPGYCNELRQLSPKSMIVIVAGKTDLRINSSKGFVSKQEGIQLAESVNADCFYEVSSKTGASLEELFRVVEDKIYYQLIPDASPSPITSKIKKKDNINIKKTKDLVDNSELLDLKAKNDELQKQLDAALAQLNKKAEPFVDADVDSRVEFHRHDYVELSQANVATKDNRVKPDHSNGCCTIM